MKTQTVSGGFILVLQKGEELIDNLTSFCKREDIKAGFLYGLGGTTSASLGYYDLDKQEYIFKDFNDLVEVVSLQGNVALKDNQAFLHVHAVVGDRSLNTYGGHVKSLTVAGTVEVYLQVFEAPLTRQLDDNTGLYLISPQ